MKKKRLLIDHPYIGAIIMVPIVFYFVQIIGGLSFMIPAEIFGLDSAMCVEFGAVIFSFLALLIYRVHLRKEPFKGVFSFTKSNCKDVYIGILIAMVVDCLCLLFAAVNLEGGIKSLVLPSLSTFILALYAGVVEETSFRAIPVSIMMKNKPGATRIVLAAIITSVIFGGIHITNIGAGARFDITILQICGASLTGLFLAAVYLRTGSILLPMWYHFFHDLINFMLPAQSTGVMLQQGITVIDLIPEVILGSVEIFFAIYLLRKVKWEEIKQTWKEKWNE